MPRPPISSCAASVSSSLGPPDPCAAWSAFAAPVLPATLGARFPAYVWRVSLGCPVADKSVTGVRIEVTPDLSFSLYRAMWDWMLNRDFESQEHSVAKIVSMVQGKGRFYIETCEGQKQREQDREPLP